MSGFPAQRDGVYYLAEGGQETEIMYKHGHDLPEFAMFPLLDRPQAVVDMRAMYDRYLETAARHGFIALMGGLDYRASADWATKLGYSSMRSRRCSCDASIFCATWRGPSPARSGKS